MSASTFARAAELDGQGRPFVVATVVAVRKPTSARPGASGIVHPDGTIEGWVGGSCAQPVVVREALRALADGQPRLLRLSKDGPAEGRRADGVIELVMTCHSGGTLEIYVEPHLPAPQLWIAGTTPIAGALAAPRLGRRLEGHGHRSDRRGRRLPVGACARLGRHPRPRSRGLAVRRRREPGHLGRGGRRARADSRCLVRGPRRLADPRRRRPRLAARGDDHRGRPHRRPAGARRPGPGRRDRRGDRPVDPGRARPGPPRAGRLRGLAWTGDGGRRHPRVDLPGAGRRRHRPARPRLRHDRGAGARPASGGTRRGVYAFCSIGCRTRFIKEPAVFLAAPGTAGWPRRRYPCPTDARPVLEDVCISKAPSRSPPPAIASGRSSSIRTRSVNAGRASRRSRSSTTRISRRRPRSASGSSARASS